MRALFVVLSAMVLAACDPIYGVTRHAKVGFMPDPAKVRAIIEHVRGVDEVRYQQIEGSKPLTLGGIQRTTEVYTFSYRGGSDVHGALQFEVDYQNRVEYRQTLLQMFQPPPQQWIDATLPVMQRIESRLETQAGLSGLRNSVMQRCDGVVCK